MHERRRTHDVRYTRFRQRLAQLAGFATVEHDQLEAAQHPDERRRVDRPQPPRLVPDERAIGPKPRVGVSLWHGRDII